MFEGIFQPMHLIVILIIVLIIFGPRRLPEFGAGLGKSIREFKNALREKDVDIGPEPKEAGKEQKQITSLSIMEAKQEMASKETVGVKKETTV